MKKIFTFLVILILFGCGVRDKNNGNKTVFKDNEAAGSSSLDRAFAKDQLYIWACIQVFNGFAQFNDEMKITPCIAKF